jgi:hypothetical protein
LDMYSCRNLGKASFGASLPFAWAAEDFDGDDCGIVLDLLKDFGWIRSRETC